MAQRMRVNGFADTSRTGRLPADVENGFARDGRPRLSSGKQPIRWPLPAPISGQYLAERARQHDLTVLVPLACTNPDDFAIAVNVADLQVGGFRHAKTRSVEGRQNRAVAKVLRGLQEFLDIFPGQDDGKLLFVAGQGNPLDIDLSVQCIAVKKAKPANGLNVRRKFDLL